MEHPPIWDYSPPLIKIRALTKEIEELFLAKKYVQAKTAALSLAVEARVLSIVAMDEQQKEERFNHAVHQ